MNTKDYFKDIYNDFFKVELSQKESSKEDSSLVDAQSKMTSWFDEINKLYITDESKDILKKMIEYMRKYHEQIEKNYVPFSLLLQTNNNVVKEKIESILFHSSSYFDYIESKTKKIISLYNLEKDDLKKYGFITFHDINGLQLEDEKNQKKFFYEFEDFVNQDNHNMIILSGTKEELVTFFLGRENIKNSCFKFHIIGTNPDDLGVGGAINILAENATIQNSNFTRNTARLGGGIYVGADSGNTVINVSVWRENVAYERGGAINLHASGVHIDDGEFYNNVAINGSAVYVGGVGTENKIHESLFDGNIASGYGAGVYWVANEGEIINSSFTRNSAVYGGGIYLNGRSSNTNITNTTFTYNNATKNGGAIDCNAEHIGIYNLTFEHNYAGEYGAALCRESGARYGHGDHNVFNYNHADIAGAALAWLGVKNIHIDYYNFTGNTAGQRGGAIYVGNYSDFCIVEHCIFTGNNVTNETLGIGGAIDINADNATVIHSIFTDNHAHVGGAIAAGEESGFTKINNVTFTGNGATIDGGAINLRATGVSVNDTRFYSNTAGRHGGALMVGGTGKNNTIYYSVFEKNVAGDHGGAIDWLAAAGDIFYSNFTANEAVYGGGIYLNGVSSNSRIFNVIFDANRATKNGGAIDCNASMMGLNNTLFTNNYAGEYGAALCREANATGGFGGNNTFIKNDAGIAGAALAWLGVDGININNYTFINNTAFKSGGAIYVRGDSPNCKVRNCYFDTNYVTDVKNGQGGSIDWVGPNGLIANTTFIDSIAVNGGTIFAGVNSTNITIFNSSFISSRALGDGGAIALYSDNAKITYSNFTFSLALISGGAISGHNADNTTIDFCIFDYGMGAGYIDSSLKAFGEGGAIHWENATDLSISNSNFLNLRSNANGGSISAVNCNDSVLYNLTFGNDMSSLSGGSISWINSTNLTFDSIKVNKSKAFENGGAFYLIGINDTIIKNSIFYDVKTPDGNGGGIYVDGNVTVQNTTFGEYAASVDYGGALYFNAGISTVIDSNFTGRDAIWVYRPATVYLTNNNITGPNPNKNMTYLERDYDSKYNPVDYSVWNDGILYLDKNSFDYVIFNNGTIMTQTYLDMLSNTTHEVEWNTTFMFYANITDDNHNTIISVHSLGTYNNHPEYDSGIQYNLTYNRLPLNSYIQDVFLLSGNDTGLAKCSYRNGTLKVKMRTELEITKTEEKDENITFIAKITLPYNGVYSNHTSVVGEKVKFVIGGKEYNGTIYCEQINGKWLIAYANVTLNHMHTGTYTITATYDGDDYHFGVTNQSVVILNARPIWIKILVDDIFYGQDIIANITTNATNTENGYIWVRINGKEVMAQVKLEKNGTKILHIPESVYRNVINVTGEYTMSVMFNNGTYYDYQINFTTFNVKKFNTNITANVTTPIKYGETLFINVTVNETATGFVSININGTIGTAYVINGIAKFSIHGLPAGNYSNIRLTYYPDTPFFNGNVTNITFRIDPTDDYNIDVKVDDIKYGENATVRVLVATDAVGNVTIYIDGKNMGTVNLTNGVAVLENVTGLAGGQHVVNVTYNGGSRYSPKDKNDTFFMVNPNDKWDMSITATYAPYGEYSVITVQTAPYNLTHRYLTITIGSIKYNVTIDDNGTATLRLNNISAGSYSGSVSYNGDANYSSLTKRFGPYIPQAVPTVIITQSNRDVIATLPENVTGNVTFYINGKMYENKTVDGVATIKNVLNFGSNYVTAIYPGDKNYTLMANVTQFDISKTNTSLTVEADLISVVVGNVTTITVRMVNVTAGKVLIEVGDYNYTVDIDKQGVAVLDVVLPVGEYTPKAYYLGDDEHKASNGTGNKFEVIKLNTTMGITVKDIVYGQSANITVTINNAATGYITIRINNTKSITLPIVEGKVNWIVSGLGADNYTVYANYSGDANYNINNTNVNKSFEVSKADPDLHVVSFSCVVYQNGKIEISINNETAGEKLNITVGTHEYPNIVIPADGKLAYNLPDTLDEYKSYDVVVKYGGNANFTNDTFKYSYYTTKVTDYGINVTGMNITVGEDEIITVKVPNHVDDVVIWVAGTSFRNNSFSGNVATFNITHLNLKAGLYTVTATVNDTEFDHKNFTALFTVNKTSLPMNITVFNNESIYVGDTVKIVVSVPKDVTENVTLEINNIKLTNVTVNGNATFYVPSITYGNKTVVAAYIGDDRYYYNSTTANFTVNKRDSQVNVTATGNSVGGNATIVVQVQTNATGYVTVNVNGTSYTIALNSTGAGSINITGLGNGTYYVHATYIGDDQYLPSVNNTETFEMIKVVPVINIAVNNVTYGTESVIVVTVPGATGNITIKINDTDKGEFTLVNGKVTFNAGILGVENYTVYVSYKGDDKYSTANADKKFNVTKADPTITIEGITVDANTNATVRVRINDASGSLNITVNNKNYTATIIGGVATFTVDKLPVGKYDIVANYTGDANYNARVETLAQGLEVIKVQKYEMNVTAVDVHVGENTTITIHVPKDATGTVTVWVNGTQKVNSTIVEGVATVQLNKTLSGRYVVNATLTDDKYADQTVNTTYWVSKVEPSMVIDVVTNDIKVGDTVEVTVTLPTDIDNEVVTLEINGETITNTTAGGIAKFYIDAVTYGNKTVVASYAGNDKYLFNSTTANFTVNKRASQVNVTVTPTSIDVGDNVTVSVKVPANATGYVIVNIGGNNYTINLTGGVGSVEIAGLKNNTYKVNVTYIGDDQYLSSINNTQTIKVNKLTTPVTIDFNSPIIEGDDVYVKVTMNSDINGVVVLHVNAPGDTKSYNVAIVNGEGGIYVTNRANATYYIYAEFNGNDKYESNTSEHKTLLVNSILTSLSITIDKNSINVGDNATIGITLNQSINAIVTVKVNGSNHTVGLVNGKGNFTLSGLANGTYIINAVFAGDDKHVNSTSNPVTLKVNKIVTSIDVGVVGPVTYGGVATIAVTMNPSINDYVVLNVAGKNYTVAIVNGKGKFNATGLDVGNYLVNVTYAGDYKYLSSSNDTVSFDVVAADLDASAIGLNVTVKEDGGIVIAVPSDFTGNVSVNISGDIRYNDTVISLINIGKYLAGNYTANVTFYGDNNYNTKSVTVNFNVTRVTPSINVTIDDVTYPKDAVANIVIGNNANGTVNITVGKKTFIGTVENGVATVNLFKLSGGIHNAIVEFFTGDDYNNNVTSALVKFLVLPNNSLISIDGAKAIYVVGEDIDIKFNVTNSTGKLDIYINGNYVTTYNSNPIYDFSPSLGEGNYTITAVLDGDENYTGFTTSVSFKVVKNNLTISVNDTTDPSTIVVGSPVTFIANLNASVTGDVIFTINGANYTVHVSNADKATYEYIPVNNATIKVVATFAGNDKYNSKVSAQKEFEVNRINTSIGVSVVSPVTYGGVATIVVTMNPSINDYVVLNVAGKNYTVAIVNGEGKFNASGLDVGNYLVNVTYAGDDKYNSSNNNTTSFDVVAADLDASAIGLNVTVKENSGLIITVPADFDGNVTVNLTDIKYEGKVIPLIDLGKLPAGSYAANVTFHDSKNYNDKSIIVGFTVDRVTPIINVTIDDATYPDKAVAHVNISDYANGTINITVDGKVFNATVTNGVADVNLTGLSAGSKVAGVEFFTSDAYNYNATASAKFTVNKANSTIVIKVENVYVYNDKIIINLATTGSAGAVNVTINGKEYPVNNKQVEIPCIAAGDYTIIADLAADENYTAATNSTTFKVKQAATSVDIGVGAVYYVGDDIEITLTTVNSTDLTVTINGKSYTVDNNNKITISGGLAAGNYTVNAILAGNENYTGSNDTESFKVEKLQSELTINVTDITADQSEIIKVNVTGGATGSVIIKVDGKDYYVKINGQYATLKLDNLTSGVHNVEVKYMGDEKYNESNGTTTFNVDKLASSVNVTVENITVGDVAAVKITVTTNATGNITIQIGNEYTTTVGVVDGEIVVIIPGLTVGDKTVNVTYYGDRVFLPSNATANFTVGKTTAAIDLVVGNVTYGEKVPVTIFVNGTGNVTLEVEGTAIKYTPGIVDGKVEYLIPSLNAGNYTLKVTYNGDANISSTTATAKFEVAKADPVITVKVEDIAYGDVEYIVITSNAKGTVNVTVNGMTIEVPLNNGRAVLRASRWNVPNYNGCATVSVPDLAVGKYPVKVEYNGNENYNKATATALFNVGKQNITVDVDVVPSIKVGETQVINITVSNINATGNVTINIDGVNYTAPLKDGKANFTTPVLASGNHTVSVIYDGDKNLTGNWTSKTFEVTKLDAPVSVEIKNSTVGGKQTITVKVPDNATGQVLIDINDKPYYANITAGKAVLVLDSLSADDYTVNVTYLGDENYTGGSDSASFKVNKNNSTLTITTQNIAVGDNEVIIFNVPEDATGNLTVKVNDKTYTVAVSGGKGNLTVAKLHRGNYTVEAQYNGDDKYLPSDKVNATFKVAKHSTEMEVVDEGNKTVVVALHENATGTVTIKLGNQTYNATVNEGVAVITLVNATPGTHEIEVFYSGDNDYANQTAKATVHIPTYESPISVTVDDIKVGDKAVITVTLPENATGNVTIEIDGVKYTEEINKGTATFEIENLTAGNKTIAVTYGGDGEYSSNFTVGNVSVEKRTATVTPHIDTIGDDLEITVDVPKNATGYVVVSVDNKTYAIKVNDGVAKTTIKGLSAGNHPVNVTYLGDDQYLPSDVFESSVTIASVNSTVSVKVDNITYGDKAVIEVTVPVDATGNVTVTIGDKSYNVNVSGGKGVLVVPDLGAGNYTVGVKYNGDAKYKSNINSTKLEVTKDKLNPDDIKVIDQGNGTVVVVVPENTTGNITVKVGNETYNATIVNGTATITLNNTAPGTHEIEVIYPGDDNHEGTSTNATVTTPKLNAPISVDVSSIDVGDTAVITVNVPENATGNVTIEIDGVTYAEEIDDGKAVFNIGNLTGGSKTIAVKYDGDNTYAANQTTANMTVSKVTPDVEINVVADGDTIIVDVTAPKDVTAPVLVDVDGVGYYVNITDGKGQLVVPGASGGNHIVVARYPGDDKYGSSANVTKSVEVADVPSSVTVKVDNITYGEDAVIEVTGPVDATGNVTVTVDGKNYTAEMSNGKATVIVPGLEAGNHTVDVVYSGDDKYAPNSTSTEVEVSKDAINPDDIKVIDQGNGTVVVVVPENATGNITIKVGDKNYTAPIVNGTAVVNVDNSTPGTHDVEVIYSGDENTDGTSTTSKVTVPKYDTPMSVTVENIKAGDNAIITVNVPDRATGNVTIEIDGVTYTGEIKSGKATIAVKDLTVGNKSVYVKYDGDDKYNANMTTAQFSVDKRNTTVKAIIEDIGAGENLTVTVILPEDATGQVLIDIDGVGYYVNITNGTGVAEIPHLGSGTYTVNVTYTGDDKYASSFTSKTFKVEKIESFVIPTAVNIVVGENENIRLIVPADATGNVTVIVGGEEYNYNLDDGTLSVPSGDTKYTVAISGGEGELIIAGLPKGEYFVSVRYNGDNKYLPSTNSTIFTVSKTDTNMDIVDKGNGTIVVILPEDATGTVTVKIGDDEYVVDVVNGTATINVDKTIPGTYTAEVSYSGDPNYASKKANATVVIPKSEAPIKIDVKDGYVGDTITVTVTAPSDATGTVTVEVDGKKYTAEVKDGKAVVNIKGLTAGDKNIVVKYSGDDYYQDNMSSSEFKVMKKDSTVSASSTNIKVGKDEVITVTVPSDAKGIVLVDINGVGYYAEVINGKAKVVVPDLPAGKYTAKVTYQGDDKYSESKTISTSFTVSKSKAPISVTGDLVVEGEDANVIVKLPKDATGTVTIIVEGQKYTSILKEGIARFNFSGLPVGIHDAKVIYSGDKKYDSNSTWTKIVVSDNNKNNNETHGDTYENATHAFHSGNDKSLSAYATGNPILVLLIMILAIGTTQLRRFKK